MRRYSGYGSRLLMAVYGSYERSVMLGSLQERDARRAGRSTPRSCDHDAAATVDGNRRAGHERGSVRAQERGDLGDLVSLTEARHRRAGRRAGIAVEAGTHAL